MEEDFVIEKGILQRYRGKGGDVCVPRGVTAIGNGAFGGCATLQRVILHESVTSVGDDAFVGCTALTYVELGDEVHSLGRNAFAGCSRLERIDIPRGVSVLRYNPFAGCTAMCTVTIPDTDTEIHQQAFLACKHLSSLRFLGTMAAWRAIPKGFTLYDYERDYYAWDYKTGAYVVHCSDGDITKAS